MIGSSSAQSINCGYLGKDTRPKSVFLSPEIQTQILVDHMNHKIVIALTLISILISLNACGGMGVVTYNAPTSPKPTNTSPLFDSGTHGFVEIASINLEEIDMTVRGERDTATVAVGPLFLTVIPWPPGIYRLIVDHTSDPPLPLEIRLAPKAGPVIFNAMNVFLVFDNGQRLQPKTRIMITPLTTLKVLGSERRYCDSTEGAELQVMEKGVSITGPSCVRLEYDAPAVPKEPFTVFIEGISGTAHRIAVPPIRFERRSRFDVYPIS